MECGTARVRAGGYLKPSPLPLLNHISPQHQFPLLSWVNQENDHQTKDRDFHHALLHSNRLRVSSHRNGPPGLTSSWLLPINNVEMVEPSVSSQMARLSQIPVHQQPQKHALISPMWLENHWRKMEGTRWSLGSCPCLMILCPELISEFPVSANTWGLPFQCWIFYNIWS